MVRAQNELEAAIERVWRDIAYRREDVEAEILGEIAESRRAWLVAR